MSEGLSNRLLQKYRTVIEQHYDLIDNNVDQRIIEQNWQGVMFIAEVGGAEYIELLSEMTTEKCEIYKNVLLQKHKD